MLVYEKRIENEEGVMERHLFGTMNNIPSEDDNQLVYLDPDGGELTPVLDDIYLDGGSHNIIRKSDNIQVDVYIQPLEGDLVNIIPGYPSEEPVSLVGITVTTMPTKVEYEINENLELSGVVIEATYSDESKVDVTADCIFDPADGTQLTEFGEKSIAVTYEDKSASFIVTVLGPYLDSIEVTTEPTKKEYFVGEELNVEGLVITAAFTDGSTQDVTADCTFVPEVFEEAGEIPVNVAYEDKTCSFNVTVAEVVATGITVTSMPTITEYAINENLDLTGVEITADFSDGTLKVVTDDCTFDPADGTKLTEYGEKSIAVVYEDCEASFVVTVLGPELTKIEVTTQPAKLNYLVNEELDITGAIVTATYGDESTQDVTANCTFEPSTLTEAGSIIITVSYEDKTCEFNVTVVEPVPVKDETELAEKIAEGGAVKLTNNITIANKLDIVNESIIDLNGNTLECSNTKARVINIVGSSAKNSAAGKCVIKNGTIKSNATSASYPPVFVGMNGTLEMEDCIIETAGKEILKTNGTESGVNVKMTNCTLNGRSYLPADGSYIFKDCTVVGPVCALYIKSGKVVLDGGSFTAEGTDGDWAHSGNGYFSTGDTIVIEACNYPGGNPDVEIINDPVFVHGTPKSEDYNNYDILAIEWRNAEEDPKPTVTVKSCVGYRYAEVVGYASQSGPYYHFTDENTEFIGA